MHIKKELKKKPNNVFNRKYAVIQRILYEFTYKSISYIYFFASIVNR